MRTPFVLACVCAASFVDASILDAAKTYWDEFPVTKDQARQKYVKSGYK